MMKPCCASRQGPCSSPGTVGPASLRRTQAPLKLVALQPALLSSQVLVSVHFKPISTLLQCQFIPLGTSPQEQGRDGARLISAR